MIDLRSAARALGGEVAGRQILAPGPGHSRRDRSLSVRPSASAPGGFTVHSHAGDDFRACRDHVAARLGLTQWRPGEASPDTLAPNATSERLLLAEQADELDRQQRRSRALALWGQGQDPTGTLVEAYLDSRRLVLPDRAADVLRFHPACPRRNEASELDRRPAMLTLLRCITTDVPLGIQRTYFGHDGRKIGRKMLGLAAGAAFKLDSNADVTTGLTIGEGTETCLAARRLGYRPVWALGSVDAIRAFPVLAGIEALTILAETGEASGRAVRECGTRWHDAGREVTVVRPRSGSDVNDALQVLP